MYRVWRRIRYCFWVRFLRFLVRIYIEVGGIVLYFFFGYRKSWFFYSMLIWVFKCYILIREKEMIRFFKIL